MYSLQVEKLQITRKLSDIVRAVGIRRENQHCFQLLKYVIHSQHKMASNK